MTYDLIIIGADSAGLTAAIYAGRKKMNTLVLTKKVGGQSVMTNNIENFPGFEIITGADLISKMRQQAEKYGAMTKEGLSAEEITKENKKFIIKTDDGQKFESKTVIIATGRIPRPLNIPGEKEFKGKGVVFCSICDAPLFGGKDAAVIGSGNAGLESALDLTKYANKIYVLEITNKIRGDQYLAERLAQSKKIEFIAGAETKEIKGEKFVEKLIYRDINDGKEKSLDVQGIFVNVGWIPATDFLKGFVDLNKEGEIVINPRTNETSVPGVFAAGDATDVKYKQCVIAAGEGAKAALSAYEHLTRN